MNQPENSTPAANPKALLPILLFLVVYLGNGIFFEYIKPTEGQMGFYVVSVVLAFSIALIAAFLQNRSLSFDEKIHICAKGIGDDNIVIMLFIFLMAGAFSGIASEAGGASSTANLLLNIIPGKFAVPGLFVIACLISMAMGTSVGTISVLAPIACAVSQNGGLLLPLCVGIVVGFDEPGYLAVPGESGADSLVLVEGDCHAVAASAEGYAAVHFSFFYTMRQGVGIVRIIYADETVSAEILDIQPFVR